jgi:hypothetical protein
MKTTTRAWISAAALVGCALAGCDATPPPDPSALPSGGSLADALRDPDPYARARSLGALLPTLGPEAVPEVQRALDEFRLDLGAVEFELLLRFWASQEPAEATAWTFKHASPLYRIAAARTVIEIWAAADPAAAVVAVESATAEASEDVARVGQLALVQGWFRTDRPGLEKYIYGLGSGVKRQRSLFAYVLALAAAEGSDAAMRWGESIPEDDPRYKLEVYRQLMSALTWADMPAAGRFCDAHCDGPFGKALRNVLVRTRLRSGEYGGDVVEWVARVPERGEEQRANKRHSLWVAYATWAYRDRESALDWMVQKIAEAEEPEPWVRFLYAEYARQLAADSPEEAIQWAERVEDEADRELTLVRIARFWRTQDEEAAEAWLSQSSLSEQAREQARNTKMPNYLPGRRGAR